MCCLLVGLNLTMEKLVCIRKYVTGIDTTSTNLQLCFVSVWHMRSARDPKISFVHRKENRRAHSVNDQRLHFFYTLFFCVTHNHSLVSSTDSIHSMPFDIHIVLIERPEKEIDKIMKRVQYAVEALMST